MSYVIINKKHQEMIFQVYLLKIHKNLHEQLLGFDLLRAFNFFVVDNSVLVSRHGDANANYLFRL